MAELNTTHGSASWRAITPSDATEFAPRETADGGVSRPRALWIGVGGNLAISDAAGRSATFKNVGSGTLLPVQPSKVLATGTTATDIVALY
jgi:hypothetical protein